MNFKKIKQDIENQFVEDYDYLILFMRQINETLKEYDIDTEYSDYDTFCLDIEDKIIEYLKINDEDIVTPELMTHVLNNMIQEKIIEDPQHTEKLKNIYGKN